MHFPLSQPPLATVSASRSVSAVIRPIPMAKPYNCPLTMATIRIIRMSPGACWLMKRRISVIPILPWRLVARCYAGVYPVPLKMCGSNMNWRKIFQVPGWHWEPSLKIWLPKGGLVRAVFFFCWKNQEAKHNPTSWLIFRKIAAPWFSYSSLPSSSPIGKFLWKYKISS